MRSPGKKNTARIPCFFPAYHPITITDSGMMGCKRLAANLCGSMFLPRFTLPRGRANETPSSVSVVGVGVTPTSGHRVARYHTGRSSARPVAPSSQPPPPMSMDSPVLEPLPEAGRSPAPPRSLTTLGYRAWAVPTGRVNAGRLGASRDAGDGRPLHPRPVLPLRATAQCQRARCDPGLGQKKNPVGPMALG